MVVSRPLSVALLTVGMIDEMQRSLLSFLPSHRSISSHLHILQQVSASIHNYYANIGTFEASSVPILQIDVVKFVPRTSQGRTSNPNDHLYIVLHPDPDLGRCGIWMRQNHEKQLATVLCDECVIRQRTVRWDGWF